jgi:hypothetical protein
MVRHRSREWRVLLEDALSELSPEKLPEKIALAEVAACRRIRDMKAKPGTESEREALEDALHSLSILKKRHFPGWNKGSLNTKTVR